MRPTICGNCGYDLDQESARINRPTRFLVCPKCHKKLSESVLVESANPNGDTVVEYKRLED